MRFFTNAAAITIVDNASAVPFPSVINVTGMGGTVSNVTVTLNNLNHGWPDDIDIILINQNVSICFFMNCY